MQEEQRKKETACIKGNFSQQFIKRNHNQLITIHILKNQEADLNDTYCFENHGNSREMLMD